MKVRHDFPTQPVTAAARNAPPAVPPKCDGHRAGQVRGALVSGGALAGIWAALHWGDPASWTVGVPTVLGGAAVSALFPAGPSPRLSLIGAARFAVFASAGILRGAFDVSLGSLHPGSLSPGCFAFRTRLPDGPPRRLFSLAITLMPGTLTARLDGDRLTVHALRTGDATRAELATLEARIAGLYGMTLEGETP